MRPIDADELVEALEIAHRLFPDPKIEYAITAIKSALTLDVEPVVRCRDCTRWEPMEGIEWGRGWCKLLGESMVGNFYCQQGERIEVEERGEE